LKTEGARAISISLPFNEVHISKVLFPFFFNMLAEGSAKYMQCRSLKIDEADHFSRLLKTTSGDTIGSITVEEITQ
jgi:serine/threonine-protein kinase HipA